MLSQRPANRGQQLVPCIAGKAFYGVKPVILDVDGGVISGEGEGALCVERPWPGQARTIFGDHARFVDSYLAPYPGMYLSGDLCVRRADGLLQITGRTDDVINVAGHRLATGEVENVLASDAMVTEAAVVSMQDPIKGQRPVAFIICRQDVGTTAGELERLRLRLNKSVAQAIAKFAVPERIVLVPTLPKTRSGKIMRRLLRNIVAGDEELGDISTLADPNAVHLVSRSWADSNQTNKSWKDI
jgi:acetyl-CoA synthetase